VTCDRQAAVARLGNGYGTEVGERLGPRQPRRARRGSVRRAIRGDSRTLTDSQ
jgi:hypothetical protein